MVLGERMAMSSPGLPSLEHVADAAAGRALTGWLAASEPTLVFFHCWSLLLI